MNSRFIARRFKSTKPASSFVESATGFFTDLRWKAANALTSSLSSEERKDLLQRLDPPKPVVPSDKKEDELIMQQSIAEAVASARAEESKLNQAKFEKEREKLLKEAEAAAMARVETDMAVQKRRIAFEQWKQEVETEREKGTPNKETAPTEVLAKEGAHPVLGPCVLDLGYKRVHVASVNSLKNIQVYEKQRIYRHDRAKVMAADKIKSMHLGLPGIIGLHEDENGKLSIIDGQHRVGMCSILQEKTNADALDRILVEVYPQGENSSNLAQEIFLEINKAEPVKLVDMPGVAKGSDRKLLTEGANRLYEAFPKMFSPSQKCRAPHLNIDNLRDTLFAANVISRHGLKSAKALEDWMLTQNSLLADKIENDEAARKGISKAALEKALKNKFYLGLESTWYYN